MNRDIKFRAWDKLRKGMVPVTGLVWDNRGLALDTLDYRDTDQWERSGDYTLMQNTGLRDKAFKEVYEGDIGKFTADGADLVGYIRYYAGQWIVDLNPPKSSKVFNGYSLTDIFEGALSENGDHPFEVIGNIYENPELLLNYGHAPSEPIGRLGESDISDLLGRDKESA